MAEQSGPQLAAGIDFTDVLVIIIYLVLIVAAAYFLTKYVAKRSLKKGMKPSQMQRSGAKPRAAELGHMVSVADRIAVDRDKTIMVVEFQGKYYLMSTAADKIECIDTVEIPDAPPVSEDAEAQQDEEQQGGGVVQRPADEDTFFKRFKKAMKVVLQSYLPKSMRSKPSEVSFEARLEEQVRKSEKTDQKEKSDQNDTTKG